MNEQKRMMSIARLIELINHLLRDGDDLPISGVEGDCGPVPVTDFDLIVFSGDVGGSDAPIPDWCSTEERAAIYRAIFCMRDGHVDLDWQSVLPCDATYRIDWLSN
jgi:hypothetical protein